MVIVEDMINETLGAYVRNWFESEPEFYHPFLDMQINVVPDDVKPIPRSWVDEVEVELDGDMRDAQDEGDPAGPPKKGSFTPQQCRAKILEALDRLGLDETTVMAPSIKTFGKQQLYQEKQRVKQELKRFDSEFRKQADRWPTHCEKECMRPLYIYHRRLKSLIELSEGKGFRSSHSDVDGLQNSHLGVVWESPTGMEGGEPRSSPPQRPDATEPTPNSRPAHGSVEELEARRHALQLQKNSVRKKLQNYQIRFEAENNRPIKFHKDILPIEYEYKVYKSAKAEMVKVEAQLRDRRR